MQDAMHAAEVWPEGHAVQEVALLRENVFAAHCVQLVAEPPVEAVPAAHAKHEPADKY